MDVRDASLEIWNVENGDKWDLWPYEKETKLKFFPPSQRMYLSWKGLNHEESQDEIDKSI